jgi:hypothetical protein
MFEIIVKFRGSLYFWAFAAALKHVTNARRPITCGVPYFKHLSLSRGIFENLAVLNLTCALTNHAVISSLGSRGSIEVRPQVFNLRICRMPFPTATKLFNPKSLIIISMSIFSQ